MVIPPEALTSTHAVAPFLLINMGLQESVLVTAIGAIIAGCGIQTIRKNLRNMRERRRQQAQLEAELHSFLSRLRSVLDQPARADYSTAVDSAPRAAMEIRALLPHGVLAEHLISWWRFNLPEQVPIYDTLNELILAHAIFDVAAARLDRCLIEAITEYNRTNKIDPLTDRLDLSFIIGRILGQPEERLLAKVGLSGKPLDFMRARCAALLASPQVMQYAGPYVDSRRRLEEAVAQLQGFLRPREEPRKSRFGFRRAQAA